MRARACARAVCPGRVQRAECLLPRGGNIALAPLPARAQFTLIGSELVFLMLSIDLLLSLTNPFTNYTRNRLRYVLCVFAVAAAAALSLLGLGQDRLGMSRFGFCWFVPETHAAGINILLWSYFYSPSLAMCARARCTYAIRARAPTRPPVCVRYAFSTGVLIYAFFRLRRGMRDTYEVRKEVFRRGRNYVLGFVVYWIIAESLYFASLGSSGEGSESTTTLLFNFVFVSRGAANLIIWFTTYDIVDRFRAHPRHTVGDGALDDEHLLPHLNLALRKEILFYTRVAVRVSMAHLDTLERARSIAPRRGGGGALADGLAEPLVRPPSLEASWVTLELADFEHRFDPRGSSAVPLAAPPLELQVCAHDDVHSRMCAHGDMHSRMCARMAIFPVARPACDFWVCRLRRGACNRRPRRARRCSSATSRRRCSRRSGGSLTSTATSSASRWRSSCASGSRRGHRAPSCATRTTCASL